MKKVVLLIFLGLMTLSLPAQEADTHIASLVNNEEWFALAEDLPQYSDSMQADYLRLIAEAMLQARTNRNEEAVAALTKLLSEHQAELGTQTALSFALLRLQLIGKQGHYAEAADGIQRIIHQLESSGVTETQALRTLQKHYAVLRNYAPLSVSRPEKDIAVPFRLITPQVTKREEWMRGGKKAYKGNLMTVPVLVHGKEYPFIFDTGAGATFLFEKTAREMGLTILPDTVTINGSQKGLRAWIDSLQIGEITCRNLVAYVGLSDAIDTLMTGVDAILGMDIIAAFPETQLRMDKQQLVFPAHPTPMPQDTKPNLLIDGSLLLRAKKDSVPLTFNLDTGCSTAELYSGYYNKFAAETDNTAQKDTISTLSYGQIHNMEVLLLPGASFMVGNRPVSMEEVYLYPSSSEYLHQHDGRIGMDFLQQFNSITINLKDMYLKIDSPQ